jgi:hypothetical protein
VTAPGLRIYCDSHDVAREPRRTVDIALRAGAVGVIAMVEGITGDRGSRRLPMEVVARFVEMAHAADLHVTACAFPDVREDPARSIDHLWACAEIADAAELDAEPRDGVHWSAAKLRPWLASAEFAATPLSITTTRIEAPRLGAHGLRVRGQLEQLTSTDTLADALTRLAKGTRLDLVEPVVGAFDQRGVVRTVATMRRDLDRCAAQARLAGGLAVWSAHTLDEDEADVLREWALATWRRAA